MEQSKKEFLLVLEGVKLSKTQNPTTAEDRKRMKVIPYASAIGSIKYAMMCTRSIVYPTLILAREYPISEEVNDDDHGTSDQVVTDPRRSTRVRPKARPRQKIERE